MKTYNHNDMENYKTEAEERWGQTDAYKEYSEKSKDYSKEKQKDLVMRMDHIMEAFAICMKTGETAASEQAQNLVQTLQNHITENYYHCTHEILLGLGQMYVGDERFQNNIDRHATGTAAFIGEAIGIYCKK